MNRREAAHPIGGLISFLLLAIFAVSMLTLVALGVNAYSHVTNAAERVSGARTPLFYVAGMVRSADRAGAISVQERAGQSALVIEKDVEGETFETVIYFYEGALREWFAPAGTRFMPEDGARLVEAEGFTVEQRGEGLFALRVVSGGEEYAMSVAQRGGR